ncbi:MAG: DNA topoisomerase III, partial [Lachnospiraceae bacterium]|nr:DNA topoisomerase III [Lachnospiraceae bacterium]
SRYLSDDMEETARKVLYIARREFSFIGNSSTVDDYSRILDSSKVSDHHAVIPTMEIASLDQKSIPGAEMNVLALVAVRLACAVSEPYRYITSKAVLSCEGEEFTLTGKTVTEPGWKEIDDTFRNSFAAGGKEREKAMPELIEGQVIQGVESKMVEGFTKPPKKYTEDSLLAAMERAGSDEMAADVERKGLGTPATRADIIEKLVCDGFLKRDKKQIVPTEDGIKLISVLPDELKSAKLTAEWENRLAEIAKGKADPEGFMEDIRGMVRKLVSENHEASEEQKALFGAGDREILGKCPRCGSDVIKGKYGSYCTKKCGMKFGKAMGKELSDEQIRKLLNGERILVKDIKSKKGKNFDAFLTPKGVSDFCYTDKDGNKRTGFQFDYHMTFPE